MNRVIKDGQTFEYFRTKKLALMYCKANDLSYKCVLGADDKKAAVGKRWHVEVFDIDIADLSDASKKVPEIIREITPEYPEPPAPPPIRKICEDVVIPITEKKLNLFARFKARLDKLFS